MTKVACGTQSPSNLEMEGGVRAHGNANGGGHAAGGACGISGCGGRQALLQLSVDVLVAGYRHSIVVDKDLYFYQGI